MLRSSYQDTNLALQNLSSNPKGITDEEVEKKFAKTEK